MPNYTFTQDDRKRGGAKAGRRKARTSVDARHAVGIRWEQPTGTLLADGRLALVLPAPWLRRLGLDVQKRLTISLEALLEHSQPSP